MNKKGTASRGPFAFADKKGEMLAPTGAPKYRASPMKFAENLAESMTCNGDFLKTQ